MRYSKHREKIMTLKDERYQELLKTESKLTECQQSLDLSLIDCDRKIAALKECEKVRDRLAEIVSKVANARHSEWAFADSSIPPYVISETIVIEAEIALHALASVQDADASGV